MAWRITGGFVCVAWSWGVDPHDGGLLDDTSDGGLLDDTSDGALCSHQGKQGRAQIHVTVDAPTAP